MINRNKVIIVTILVFSLFAVFLVVALIQSPPTKVKPHEHEEESNQSAVFEATLDNIDQSTAKTFTFKVEGMNSKEAVGKIVDPLHSSFEGSVGKVTADVKKQILTLECDAAKVSEEKALEIIKSTGYQAEVISGQATQ